MTEAKRARPDESIPFSRWTSQIFEEQMGFSFSLDQTEKMILECSPISQQQAELCAQQLAMTVLTQEPVAQMNETSREDLVKIILTTVIYTINTSKASKVLTLKREEHLRGTLSIGRVEFVIKAHPVILMVVEAKRSDLEQGLLQNMIEICQAARNNANNRRVYGIVTTVENWIFLSYSDTSNITMKNWSVSPLITAIPPVQDQGLADCWIKPVNEITGIIHWMLQQSILENQIE